MKANKPYEITGFQEIDSTNAYALKNLSNLPDKQVIVSDRQTAGRGRFERKWISDKAGNVYLSIILKPCSDVNSQLPLANLTQYMSVVICKILKNYGVVPEIKWPNDVLVKGKKIAGILSQSSIQGKTFKGLVLGVGINLNLTEEELSSIDKPATSLNLLLGKVVQRDVFIEELLDAFFDNYEAFLAQGFCSIKEDYLAKNCFIGEKISVSMLNETILGMAKEINHDGSLVILDDKMQEKNVLIGDIAFL